MAPLAGTIHKTEDTNKLSEHSGWPLTWRTWKSQGKRVLAYGQLPRVLILRQNVQKRNYLLSKVVHHIMYKQRLSHWSILKNAVVIKMS